MADKDAQTAIDAGPNDPDANVDGGAPDAGLSCDPGFSFEEPQPVPSTTTSKIYYLNLTGYTDVLMTITGPGNYSEVAMYVTSTPANGADPATWDFEMLFNAEPSGIYHAEFTGSSGASGMISTGCDFEVIGP
jgi:hypothetical protein